MHVWSRFRQFFFAVTACSYKVNTTVFAMLQLLRELEFDNDNIVIIQVKASKFATC